MTLPDPVLRTLADFEDAFGLEVRLMVPPGEPGTAAEILYSSAASDHPGGGSPIRLECLAPRDGSPLDLEVLGCTRGEVATVVPVLARSRRA